MKPNPWKLLVLAASLTQSVCSNAQNLLVNGSFEAGAAGWTFTGELRVLGPPTNAPVGVEGTHCAAIGWGDVPNSTLSQEFSLVPDTDYLVTFAIAAGADPYAGRPGSAQVDILSPDNSVLSSRSFTNVAPGPLIGTNGFVRRAMTFTSPTNASSATLRITDTSAEGGLAIDPLIDHVSVVKLPVDIDIRIAQIEISWLTVTNKTYQPQYRFEMSTNEWTNFGSPLPGTGNPMSFLYSIPGDEPHRFFRVQTTP